jgi:hypothetical protein
MSLGRLSENEQAQLIRLRRKKAALTMVIRALERYMKISLMGARVVSLVR